MMKKLLFSLIFQFSLLAMAQYPISSINISMPSGPAANTADWVRVMPPVMITAQAQMRNGQVPGDVQESKILVTIKQGGSKKYGSFTPDNAPSAGFTTAVKTWGGSSIGGLLGKDVELPPGSYELCVQFFTYNTPAKPLSNEVCKPFTIADTKPGSYMPPNNISPVDKKAFTEKETKEPMGFRWTPIFPRPPSLPIYKLKVWQLMQGQTGSQAIKSSQPVLEKEVKDQTQTLVSNLYTGPCKPPYLCNWVWVVEAVDGQGKVLGVSEATSFSVGNNDGNEVKYTPPVNQSPVDKQVFTDKDAKGNLTFRWTPLMPYDTLVDSYRLKVWQLMQGQNGQQAMRTNKPIIEKEMVDVTETSVANLYTGPCKPPYMCKWVWRVEAVDGQGKVLGVSEATEFNLFSKNNQNFIKCLVPKSIKGNFSDEVNMTVNCIDKRTPEGLPIVKGNVVVGNITNVPFGTVVSIYQIESGDYGSCLTDKTGAFKITLGHDTVHTIYVNKKEYGKIKIESNKTVISTNDSIKSKSAGGGYYCQCCGYEWKDGDDAQHPADCCNPKIIVHILAAACQLHPTCDEGGIICRPKIIKITDNTPALLKDQLILRTSAKLHENKITILCQSTASNLTESTIKKFKNHIIDVKPTGLPLEALNLLLKSISLPKINKNILFEPSSISYSITNEPKPTIIISETANISISNKDYELKVITLIPINDSIIQSPCCKGGTWGNKHIEGIQQVLCGTTINQTIPCNTTRNVNFSYTCNNSITPPCPAKIDYIIKDVAGNTVFSALNINSGTSTNITTPSAPGFYCLVIYAKCGQTICDSCTICFKVECQLQKDCCKGSKWINKQYSISNLLIKTKPVLIDCNKSYTVPYHATGTITFNADYLCNTPNCTKQVFVKIMIPGGPDFTSAVPYSWPLNVAGNYSVTYYAICGKDTCDSCKFNINILDKPADCCKGSYWISKSINWSGIKDKGDLSTPTNNTSAPSTQKVGVPISGGTIGLPPTSINIANCETSYKLNQGGTYTFNADYQCATKTCAKQLLVKIKGIGNSWYDGTFAMPKTITFSNPGDYAITYIAVCGTDTCARCPFALTITPNCCHGSHWKKAEYQIVNLNADGSWDRSNTTFYNLLGGGVPTLSADLGISIENLSFECADQRGCEAGFIIKRKNLTTGALVSPDETLPFGQISTSIYSKPFPQLITIVPTCGEQLCGPAIIFKVECLHKDCIPLLNTVVLNSGEDALLHSLASQQSTNFGTFTSNPTSNWTFNDIPAAMYSVIKFNIPAGITSAMITSAKLSLKEYIAAGNGNHAGQYGLANQPTNFVIRRVTSPWSESVVSWSTMPTTTTINQVSELTYTGGSANDDLDIDVTQLVKDILTSGSNQGFMIRFNDNILTNRYRSRWFGSFECPVISKKPTLTIN